MSPWWYIQDVCCALSVLAVSHSAVHSPHAPAFICLPVLLRCVYGILGGSVGLSEGIWHWDAWCCVPVCTHGKECNICFDQVVVQLELCTVLVR